MNEVARRLIAHAALSGPFAPSRYLYDMSEAQAQAALRLLAPLCQEVVRDGEVLWIMHNADRAQTLAVLVRQPGLPARLWRKRPPLRGDAFALALKACLSGSAHLDPDDCCPEGDDRQPRLRAAISAAIVARPLVDDDRREEIRAFELALYRRSVESAEEARRRLVLPFNLCGRVEERAAVLGFVEGRAILFPARALDGDPGRASRILLLTGSPGMGKSAFLADLVPRLRDITPARWIVTFDFDQTTLAHGGPIAWTEEVTRQIGAQDPALAGPLSAARTARALERQSITGEATISAADLLLEDTRTILAEAAPRPILVVFDTIEEITAQDMRETFSDAAGYTLFYRLMSWLDRLAMLCGDMQDPVTAIAAGRTPPPVPDATRDVWFDAWLDLPDLDSEAAKALLGRLDKEMSETTRSALVAAVGGHPLHLILIVKHLDSLPRRQRGGVIEDLSRQGLRGMESDAVLRTLYSRFLDRLRVRRLPEGLTRDDIKALAHPGLLLREVTQEVLAEVIAPAVGVDLSPPGYAADAFKALGEQVWLVTSAHGSGTIQHRRDVRRVMLPMMLSDPNPAHVQVLEAAIAYYDKAGLPDEAGYLHALRGDAAWFRTVPARAAAVYLIAGDDLEVMSLPVRAMLKFLSPEAGALSRTEIEALPTDLASEAAMAEDVRSVRQTGARAAPNKGATDFGMFVAGRDLLKMTEMEAGDLLPEYEAMPAAAPEPVGAEPPPYLLEWLDPGSDGYTVMNDHRLHGAVELAFVAGDFQQVAELGWAALRRIGMWPDPLDRLRTEVPFEEHWFWRLTLASIIGQRSDGWQDIGPLGAIHAGNLDSDAVREDYWNIDAFFFGLDALCGPRFSDPAPVPDGTVASEIADFRHVRLLFASPVAREVLRDMGPRFGHFPILPDHLPLLSPILRAAFSRNELELRPPFRDTMAEGFDPQLLATLFSPDAGREAIATIAERLYFMQGAREPGYSAVGGLAICETAFSSDHGVLNLLARGQTPELHRTLASALLDDFGPDAAGAFRVVRDAASAWPDHADRALKDLSSARASRRDRFDRAIELIRFTDLCGLLPRLVAELATGGQTQRLRAINQLFDELGRQWTWPLEEESAAPEA